MAHSLNLKLKDAYLGERFCDVKLLCQDNSLKCHSVVLQVYSNFFAEKLSGKWTKTSDCTEFIVDCSNFKLCILKMIVDFMYGISVNIDCENVTDLLHAGTYFMIDDFIETCKLFLEKSISETSVFSILTISDQFVLNDIKSKCLVFIDSNFVTLCSNFAEDFYKLPSTLIKEIIARDSLVVSEEFLFDILSVFCGSHVNEAVWSEFNRYIRFCNMNLSFFSSKCVFSNILPADVSNKIFKFLTSTETVTFPNEFPKVCTPRICNSDSDIVIKRFMSKSSDPVLNCDSLDGERLSFVVSEKCMLRSVGIFTKQEASYMLRLKLLNNNSGHILADVQKRILCKDNIFMIQFRSPVQLLENVTYTVQLFLEGNSCFQGLYGAGHRHCNALNNILKISFKEPTGGSTTVIEGQFPVFVFCKL